TATPRNMPVAWLPTPIEFPNPGEFKWTNDEDIIATPAANWPGDGNPAAMIRFNLAADTALVALANGNCHLIDTKTAESRQRWKLDNANALVELAITLDGKHVVAQHKSDPHLYVHDFHDGKMLRSLADAESEPSAFAVAADPRLLAVGTEKGEVQL